MGASLRSCSRDDFAAAPARHHRAALAANSLGELLGQAMSLLPYSLSSSHSKGRALYKRGPADTARVW